MALLVATAAFVMTRGHGLENPARPPLTTATAQAPPAIPRAPVTQPGAETPPAAAVPPAPATPPASETPTRYWGLEVATYVDEDRAAEETSRLAEATRLPCGLRTVAKDGTPIHHLIVGVFDDRTLATRVGAKLVERGLIRRIVVVRLPAARRVAS